MQAAPRCRQGQQELRFAVPRDAGDHRDLAQNRAPQVIQRVPTCAPQGPQVEFFSRKKYGL